MAVGLHSLSAYSTKRVSRLFRKQANEWRNANTAVSRINLLRRTRSRYPICTVQCRTPLGLCAAHAALVFYDRGALLEGVTAIRLLRLEGRRNRRQRLCEIAIACHGSSPRNLGLIR